VQSNNSKYVTGKSVQKVTGKSGQSGFVRMVRKVLYDRSLSPSAKCVYGVLADRVGYGCTARIGQRRIAAVLGFHQETVAECLRELQARGHIEIVGTGRQRRTYILLSNTFGRDQGRRDVIVSGPSGVPRYASLDNERHGLPRVGEPG
jgi:hypothetical protein